MLHDEKTFKIASVSKADIINIYEEKKDFEKIKAKIEKMSDSDMKNVASKMADDYYTKLFWKSLKTIIENYF